MHKPRICIKSSRSLSAQAPESSPESSIVRQLSEMKFPPGDGPDCLHCVWRIE